MARTSSLLVAIALAAAPHTAHALGKTEVCDCPALDAATNGFDVPCGAEFDTYVPPEEPCGPYMCDTGEWVRAVIDCYWEMIGIENCIESGGTYTPPPEGQCCGNCEGGTIPDGRK